MSDDNNKTTTPNSTTSSVGAVVSHARPTNLQVTPKEFITRALDAINGQLEKMENVSDTDTTKRLYQQLARDIDAIQKDSKSSDQQKYHRAYDRIMAGGEEMYGIRKRHDKHVVVLNGLLRNAHDDYMTVYSTVANRIKEIQFYQIRGKQRDDKSIETLHLLLTLQTYLDEVRNKSDMSADDKYKTMYDLLIIYTSEIHQVVGKRNRLVNSMISLVDLCHNSTNTPPSVKKDHIFRRGLVLFKNIKWGELYKLAKEAIERTKGLFAADFVVSFGRKLKMIFGNIRPTKKNLAVVSGIHSHMARLSLPVGYEKVQLEQLIDQLGTEFLTLPHVNGANPVISLDGYKDASESATFRFEEILNIIKHISDGGLLEATGETADSLDVKTLNSKTKLLRDARAILFSGTPSMMTKHLVDKPELAKTLKAIFTQLRQLETPVTWGEALDQAVFDFVGQVKDLSRDMMIAIDANPMPKKLRLSPSQASEEIQSKEESVSVVKEGWSISSVWKGTQRIGSSIVAATRGVVNTVVPWIAGFFSRLENGVKLASLTADVKTQTQHTLSSAKTFFEAVESLSLYDKANQGMIDPIREMVSHVDLAALQKAGAVYHHKVEPAMKKLSVPNGFTNMSETEKNELYLNSLAAIHYLQDFIFSVMPMIEGNQLQTMLDNLQPGDYSDENYMVTVKQARQAFVEMNNQIAALQQLTQNHYTAAITPIQHLLTSGEPITANTMIGETVRTGVEGTVTRIAGTSSPVKAIGQTLGSAAQMTTKGALYGATKTYEYVSWMLGRDKVINDYSEGAEPAPADSPESPATSTTPVVQQKQTEGIDLSYVATADNMPEGWHGKKVSEIAQMTLGRVTGLVQRFNAINFKLKDNGVNLEPVQPSKDRPKA